MDFPTVDEINRALEMVSALVAGGRRAEARALLRQMIAAVPSYDKPWLQLLALDPTPSEETALLEAFLQQHPAHKFAAAMRARLEHTRIVALLDGNPHSPQRTTTTAATSTMRLGEYLIGCGWVTADQIDGALADQKRLREAGIDQRLGAVLLMRGQLQPAQLAVALAEISGSGFGEFGDYLVRSGTLTTAQVGEALARQAAIAARLDREYLAAMAARRTGALGRLLSRGHDEPRRKAVPKLGEVLVEMGVLTEQQVDQLLRERMRVLDAQFH